MVVLGEQCTTCTAVWTILGLFTDRQSPGEDQGEGTWGFSRAYIAKALRK